MIASLIPWFCSASSTVATRSGQEIHAHAHSVLHFLFSIFRLWFFSCRVALRSPPVFSAGNNDNDNDNDNAKSDHRRGKLHVAGARSVRGGEGRGGVVG